MFHNPDFTEETYPDNLNEYVADNDDDSTYASSLAYDDDGITSWDGISAIDLIPNSTPSPIHDGHDMSPNISDQRSDDDTLNTPANSNNNVNSLDDIYNDGPTEYLNPNDTLQDIPSENEVESFSNTDTSNDSASGPDSAASEDDPRDTTDLDIHEHDETPEYDEYVDNDPENNADIPHDNTKIDNTTDNDDTENSDSKVHW